MAKILIMDSEASSRNLVTNMLRPLGHTIIGTEDGKRAIESARKENPEIALLDMQVADMEGTEVLMEMKKIKPDMKCIMISGFGDEVDVRGAMGLGAHAVISKPFKITEVHKAVQGKPGSAASVRPLAAPAAAAPAPAAPRPAPTAPASAMPADVAPISYPPAAAAAQPMPAADVPRVHQPPARQPDPPASAGEPAYERTVARSFPLLKVAAGVLVAAVALGAFLFARGVSKPDVKAYSLSYANPTGMCNIQSNLWISDWTTGNIYQHSHDEKLSISGIFKSDNQHPTGLAFDGDFVWSCSPAEKRLYKHRLDASLTVVSIYALPTVTPQGLYFDGVNIWIIDSEAAKIYKNKMDDTLSVVAVYDSPAINPCGMFRVGEFFYIGDYKTGKIFKASIKDLTVSEIYELPNFDKEKDKLAGIAWDGNHLWACYDGMSQIFRHGLKGLKKVKL